MTRAYEAPYIGIAVWRVLTAAVFHMGALHLAFNMLAFVPIGQSLERLVGTVHVLTDIPVLLPAVQDRKRALSMPYSDPVSPKPDCLSGSVLSLPSYVCCERLPCATALDYRRISSERVSKHRLCMHPRQRVICGDRAITLIRTQSLPHAIHVLAASLSNGFLFVVYRLAGSTCQLSGRAATYWSDVTVHSGATQFVHLMLLLVLLGDALYIALAYVAYWCAAA